MTLEKTDDKGKIILTFIKLARKTLSKTTATKRKREWLNSELSKGKWGLRAKDHGEGMEND